MTPNSADRALSFGQAAQHYDNTRPSYPAAAVRWAVGDVTTGPEARGVVVDLGAGTGILSRVLTSVTDATITPVEPDRLMRGQLMQKSPDLSPVDGSAESIPLPDGSVDAVLAAQAYHWFDRQKAHAEIARVVRSGGVFAPIWNIRDESVDWVAEYTRLVDDGGQNGHQRIGGRDDFGPHFGSVATATFRHSVTMTADDLVALVESRSYYLTSTTARQTDLRARIRTLAETLPETFQMPYVTYCYRAIRS